MKASKFVSDLKDIAKNHKTVYAWGMFGSQITKYSVTLKAGQYPSWYTASKVNTVFLPLCGSNPPAWGFDCIGLIKGVLWGWNGDISSSYGGAKYASGGVPDTSADAMIGKCSEVSTDFSSVAVGEFLWMKGHCGIYIGNGLAIESTPSWKNGVQITACNRYKSGFNTRFWAKHGKLPYIEYESGEVKDTVTIELSVLKNGSKGEQVKTLQRLLNAFGNSLSVDGDFGSKTDNALRSFQRAKGLTVDGICGKNSWTALLK